MIGSGVRRDAACFRVGEDNGLCVFPIPFYRAGEGSRYFRGKDVVDGGEDVLLYVDLFRGFYVGCLQDLGWFVVVAACHLAAYFYCVACYFCRVGCQCCYFFCDDRFVTAFCGFQEGGQACSVVCSRRPKIGADRTVLREVGAYFASIGGDVFGGG